MAQNARENDETGIVDFRARRCFKRFPPLEQVGAVVIMAAVFTTVSFG